MFACSAISIKNSTIYGTRVGIAIRDKSYGVIDCCKFIMDGCDKKASGVLLMKNSECLVKECVFSGKCNMGVYCFIDSNAIIDKCTFRELVGKSILILKSSGCIITNSTFIKAGGITLASSSSLSLFNSFIHNTTIASSLSKLFITNSSIYNYQSNCIILSHSSSTIHSSSFNSFSYPSIHTTDSLVLISASFIRGAIAIRDCSSATINGCNMDKLTISDFSVVNSVNSDGCEIIKYNKGLMKSEECENVLPTAIGEIDDQGWHKKACVCSICEKKQASRILSPCGHYCICNSCDARVCPICNSNVLAKVIPYFEDTCIICLSNKANSAILPCGHCCVCYNCGRKLRKQHCGKNCPICERKINNIKNK